MHGNVAEVGVHHGKFFTALALTSLTGESRIAIDLFDSLQHLNTDRSGKADTDIFFDTLKQYDISQKQVQVWRGSSSNISETDARWGGQIRLWSVDGGHTAELTFNDLVRLFLIMCACRTPIVPVPDREALSDRESHDRRYWLAAR